MGDSQSEAAEGMVLDTRLEIFTALHMSGRFVS